MLLWIGLFSNFNSVCWNCTELQLYRPSTMQSCQTYLTGLMIFSQISTTNFLQWQELLSVNKDNFYPFLSNLDSFSFSWLIRTGEKPQEQSWKAVLRANIFCLVPDLWGKSFRFYHAVSCRFIVEALITLKKFSSVSSLLRILIRYRCWIQPHAYWLIFKC